MKYILIISFLFLLSSFNQKTNKKVEATNTTIVCPSGWLYTCYMIGNGTVYKGSGKIRIEH